MAGLAQARFGAGDYQDARNLLLKLQDFHPDYHAEKVDVLAARLQSGETLDLEAVLVQHPTQAQELRELWPVILGLAKPGSQSTSHAGNGLPERNTAETDASSTGREVRYSATMRVFSSFLVVPAINSQASANFLIPCGTDTPVRERP